MKTSQGSKLCSFILAAALIAGLIHVTHASAQEGSYLVDLNTGTVTPLGALGGSYTLASAINEAGQVVGSSYTAAGAEVGT